MRRETVAANFRIENYPPSLYNVGHRRDETWEDVSEMLINA